MPAKIGKPTWRRYLTNNGAYCYRLRVQCGEHMLNLAEVAKCSELWTIISIGDPRTMGYSDNVDGEGYKTATSARDAAVRLLLQILEELR